ncbi:hypothetical protein DXT76_01185 [Halobacillus trueperi]|uniref:Uncharacterized protein n=1 Tax=Halobacillus trueperi TaxID=156205 RepID=A0A3D8VTI5_9BACI|nr:hypothetical protein [Halobacillus trueperi]RDY72581.1 hypothetical protein DXT76_01185 [Halobacillus trueperi]
MTKEETLHKLKDVFVCMKMRDARTLKGIRSDQAEEFLEETKPELIPKDEREVKTVKNLILISLPFAVLSMILLAPYNPAVRIVGGFFGLFFSAYIGLGILYAIHMFIERPKSLRHSHYVDVYMDIYRERYKLYDQINSRHVPDYMEQKWKKWREELNRCFDRPIENLLEELGIRQEDATPKHITDLIYRIEVLGDDPTGKR